MSSLAVRGAAKSFGTIRALSDVDLTVEDGEFCVIAGPSGAGKTTLLRTIAGLESLDAGSIEIDGEPVTDWRPGERNVSLVFRTNALLPRLSAYDNLAFGLKARGVRREEVETRVGRIAPLLGIADLLQRPTRELTPPAQRRVAIARALVGEPGLCLLDDPLSDINGDTRDAIRTEIKLLHHEYPMTKLLVTGDPLEAMTLGERVVVIRDGRIEQDGTPLELFERPTTRFVAGYFGWPKMNFLHGTLVRSGQADSIRLEGVDQPVRLPPNRIPQEAAEGASVILGLRPEHMLRAIRVSPSDGMFRHEAQVETVQPVGTRLYATFRLGKHSVTAELQAHDVSGPGDRVRLDINLKRATLFDGDTEKALRPGVDLSISGSIGGAAPGNVENRAGGE